MRLLLFFLLIAHLLSCSLSNPDLTPPCEEIILSYDNLHDTSKVVLEGKIVFDTSANEVSGKVIDRETLLAVNNAHVSLKQGNKEFNDTSIDDGKFSVFKDNFYGMWTMTVTHTDYTCLVIDSIWVEGGQDLTVKLKK